MNHGDDSDDLGYLCWAPELGQTIRDAIVCGRAAIDTAARAAEAFADELHTQGRVLTEMTVHVARSFTGTHESFYVLRDQGASWLAYQRRG